MSTVSRDRGSNPCVFITFVSYKMEGELPSARPPHLQIWTVFFVGMEFMTRDTSVWNFSLRMTILAWLDFWNVLCFWAVNLVCFREFLFECGVVFNRVFHSFFIDQDTDVAVGASFFQNVRTVVEFCPCENILVGLHPQNWGILHAVAFLTFRAGLSR